ncbi:MAG: hypothetical protein N0C90_24260 [Candidatus Thiodiazotropha endolucinida]|nr:hypothetical protein [Candidatus Thiodiazotropha endolucinida]
MGALPLKVPIFSSLHLQQPRLMVMLMLLDSLFKPRVPLVLQIR